MGFEEGQIILDSTTGAYYSGQSVNGRVIFELSKVKTVRGIFVKIKGFCSVHWTSQESRRVNDRTEHYTVSHDSHEEYINLKVYVVGSKNAEHNLNPGKYEYPFSFQIPDSCPSSFEGTHGHVRYELKAVADRPYKIDQEISHPLRVIAPLDLNYQNCKDPRHFEFEQTYCCWCMSAGASQTLVKLPATGFCPGQVIPLEVSCRNDGSVEIAHIKFAIKMDTTYRAEQKPGHKYDHDTLLEVRKGPIPGNTERNWTVELEVPEMSIHNLDSCSFIDIHYTFKVKVEVSGCHSDSDDSCPIIFGTIPIVGFQDNLLGPQDEPNQLPVPNNPYPPPIVNQPIATSNFQGVNSSYPGPNQPYPAVSPYPAPDIKSPYPNPTNPYPNPPYPTVNPLPNINSPYPGGNSSYPNTSPYPGASPPFPISAKLQGNSPYPNSSPTPGANPPYPITTPVQGNSPYPNGSPNPGANPPYPITTTVQGNPPYPNGTPNPGANPPYPITTPVQGNCPYPNGTPNPGPNPPYPITTPVQGNSPYPKGSPNPGANPPYPITTPAQGNPPYPNGSPNPGANPPYPLSTPVQGNPPYPNATPHPIPGSNAPYPGASPYPMSHSMGTGLKTGTLGFLGAKSPASVPLLPPGAGVPYPPTVTSPYATASAPEPATPGSDQKNLADNPNNSPYNPEFINKN